MADINDVARDVSALRQKVEEMDRRLIQMSLDIQKIAARFGSTELSKDESILDKI